MVCLTVCQSQPYHNHRYTGLSSFRLDLSLRLIISKATTLSLDISIQISKMSSMSLGRMLANSDLQWFFSRFSCLFDAGHQKLLNHSATTDSLIVAGGGGLHSCIMGQCAWDLNRKSAEPGHILKDRLMGTHLQAHGHTCGMWTHRWSVETSSGCGPTFCESAGQHKNKHDLWHPYY